MDNATMEDVKKGKGSTKSKKVKKSEADYGYPLIPECEVIDDLSPEGNEEAYFKMCTKNPGHPTFIPVCDFKSENLPNSLKNDVVMQQIKIWCDKTVKISVKYTSTQRPDNYPNTKSPYPYRDLRGSKRHTRSGTGYIMDSAMGTYWPYAGTPCPCHLCRNSPNPEMEFVTVDIGTATHVVFDSEEAKETVVELFHDDPNSKNGVKYLYGYKLKTEFDRLQPHSDRIVIKCATHDKSLIEMLPPMDSLLGSPKSMLPIGTSCGVLISHPHGCSKRITVGNFIQQNRPIPIDHLIDSPFEFGPGTRFRFSEDCSEKRIDSFQRFTGLNFPLKPEKEYVLTEELTVTLPDKALYVFQYKDLYVPWVTFPRGTKLSLPGRKRPFVVLPDMMEFDLTQTRNTLYPKKYMNTPFVCNHEEPYYVTYDIDSCPGSSGAPLMFSTDGQYWTCHLGALPDGTNLSGVSYHRF